MCAKPAETGARPPVVLPQSGMDQLLDVLSGQGYRLVGPTLRDSAIVYDDIASAADLPAGWTDEQDGGSYRLRQRDDAALFGYNVGPQSWKKFLFPPSSLLWRGERQGGEFAVGEPAPGERIVAGELAPGGLTVAGEPAAKFAFIGVRSCELSAIAIQDRVFLGGDHPDPIYGTRREGAFIVAVNCGEAGGTCFCASMDTGPRASSGFDLALTELLTDSEHRFLAEAGSRRGEEVLDAVPHQPASTADIDCAERATENALRTMGRAMDTSGIRDLLYANLEHARWDDVASRCLTCGNCTMACPTCFCFRIEDATDLAGNQLERTRSWDSCFSVDHSYLHGAGATRVSGRSRYRQWMTHKLATWIDQFGSSGCVGCGRCITWCPVGIDITEEVAAIRSDDTRVAAQVPAGGDGFSEEGAEAADDDA
jgi:sulfhydrogenase subunit beta (sulfur reductase)